MYIPLIFSPPYSQRINSSSTYTNGSTSDNRSGSVSPTRSALVWICITLLFLFCIISISPLLFTPSHLASSCKNLIWIRSLVAVHNLYKYFVISLDNLRLLGVVYAIPSVVGLWGKSLVVCEVFLWWLVLMWSDGCHGNNLKRITQALMH